MLHVELKWPGGFFLQASGTECACICFLRPKDVLTQHILCQRPPSKTMVNLKIGKMTNSLPIQRIKTFNIACVSVIPAPGPEF